MTPGSANRAGRAPGAGGRRSAPHLVAYTDATARGGAEVVLRNLIGGLPARYAVSVVGVDEDVAAWVAATRPGARVEVVPPVRGKTDVAGFVRLRRALAALGPDIFQANLTSLPSCQYALLAAATIPGLPLVAVEHSPLASPAALSRRLKRWTSSRLAAHVAVGSLAAQRIEALIGLRPGTIRVIHNGVPAPPPARSLGIASPVVCAVGRLDPLKGFDVLVDAVAGMDGVHLLLVGDGPERARLEASARALGLEQRVHLTGWSDDAAALIAGSDLFVLPSRLESLPLTVLEAMRAGVPVVATPVGSVPEAVEDEVTGLLVPVGDAGALRAAIGRVLADPAWREQLASAARQRVDAAFSLERMVAGYVAVYDGLLD